jgi:hypothetical protein
MKRESGTSTNPIALAATGRTGRKQHQARGYHARQQVRCYHARHQARCYHARHQARCYHARHQARCYHARHTARSYHAQVHQSPPTPPRLHGGCTSPYITVASSPTEGSETMSAPGRHITTSGTYTVTVDTGATCHLWQDGSSLITNIHTNGSFQSHSCGR